MLEELTTNIEKHQSRLQKELTRDSRDASRQETITQETPVKIDTLDDVSIYIEINHGNRSDIERLLEIDRKNKNICVELLKKVSENYSGFNQAHFVDELGAGQLKNRFWDVYNKEYVNKFEVEEVSYNKIGKYKYAENDHLSIPDFYSYTSSYQGRGNTLSILKREFDSNTLGEMGFENSEQIPERSEGEEDMVDMDLLDEKTFKERHRWISKSCQV